MTEKNHTDLPGLRPGRTLKIFLIFLKIGVFTIGGGHAVIPLIERDIVNRNWLSRNEFYELIAMTESLPGVFATNIAAFVGYKVNGLKGGILAALGTIIAPFCIILLLALFFTRLQENIWVAKAFKALRPAAVALIVAPCFSMARASKLTLKTAIFPAMALVLMIVFKVSPVWIVILGCCGGLLYSFRLRT